MLHPHTNRNWLNEHMENVGGTHTHTHPPTLTSELCFQQIDVIEYMSRLHL